MIQLNNNPFIIRIVRNVHSFLQPGYICEGRGQSSGISTSASAAITSVYQSIFGSKTKYAGLSYLGLDQPETAQKLLEGITFRPFIIELENITVFVSCLEEVQSVFYQHIDKNFFVITIYQNSQIVAEYKDISPNAVWNKTGVLTSILGDTLFVINHSITLDKINQARQELGSCQLPNQCMLTDWNNEIIMEHLYELYLKRNIRRSVEWRQVFQNWMQQKSHIIELYTHFCEIYDLDYKFQERELHAWRMMLRATGCTNITPYNKDVSCNEFWTNVPDPEKDRKTIAKLYEEGLLNVNSQADTLWNCFRNSYNANSKGIDGKMRILSIIAENFTYKEIIEQLEVSPNSVSMARKHSRINGPGCPALEKPVIVRSKMSEVKEKEFQLFFADKANVNMSSYKMDAKTQMPDQLIHKLECLRRHLKRNYERELFVNKDGTADHVDCINHCLLFAFGECMHQHVSRCQECDEIFTLFKDLTNRLDPIHHPKLLEYQEQLVCYLAHQTTRKAYLNLEFNSTLRQLDNYGAIIVVDYKMRILPATSRETKSEFFGKRGRWYDWYNIEVRGWIFLEPGEAKTTVDSHHATIAHAIKRYIRVGCDLTEGENIETALQDLSGTSVSHIEPNRNIEILVDQENSGNNQKSKNTNEKKPKTIPGISKWFEWNWPITGQFAGYIRARSLPHIGKWNDFSPAQIDNLYSTVRPSPTASDPTKSSTPWIMPIPKKTDRRINEINEDNEITKEITAENNKSGSKYTKKNSYNIPIILILYTLCETVGNGWALLLLKPKTWQIVIHPENMHTCLKIVEEENIEEIPTVKTIKGWIGRYSANFKKEASEKTLVENMENSQSITAVEGSTRPNKRQKKG
ncbi:uncharacterized protein OCT59_020540 [Rhizophagus irregularis]|uniref:uncharacterized protein n=2 Tax=Rhizophagus irregularis TaxID=588596 RepID=UPI00331C660B|nr:hypothetical protein OCT59_020540 [Rhizophagus irregularis]